MPMLPIMTGVGMMRVAAQRGGRHATRRFIIGADRRARFAGRRRGDPGLQRRHSARRSCRRWCRPCSRRSRRSASPGCRPRARKAARSWIRSRASGSTSSVAEEDRLEYLNPPKKTPELFEKFLPYAIALDVREQLGEALHRRAGGGRRRRCGVVLVRRRQPATPSDVGTLHRSRRATACRRPSPRRRRRRDRAAAVAGRVAAADRRAAARPAAAAAAAAVRDGDALSNARKMIQE